MRKNERKCWKGVKKRKRKKNNQWWAQPPTQLAEKQLMGRIQLHLLRASPYSHGPIVVMGNSQLPLLVPQTTPGDFVTPGR